MHLFMSYEVATCLLASLYVFCTLFDLTVTSSVISNLPLSLSLSLSLSFSRTDCKIRHLPKVFILEY